LALMTIGAKNVMSETLYTGAPINNGNNLALGNSVLGFNVNTAFSLTSNYSASAYPNGSLTYVSNGSWLVGGSPTFGTVGSGCHATVSNNAWICIAP
jgi:hypothetical protein